MIKKLMQFLAKIFSGMNGGGPAGAGPIDNQNKQYLDNELMEELDKLLLFLENERDNVLRDGRLLGPEDYQRAHFLETIRSGIEATVNEMKGQNPDGLTPGERSSKVSDKIVENMNNIISSEHYKENMQDYMAKNPKLAKESMEEVLGIVSHKINSLNLGSHASSFRGITSTLAMDSYETMAARPETPLQKAGMDLSDDELNRSVENALVKGADPERRRDNDMEHEYKPTPQGL